MAEHTEATYEILGDCTATHAHIGFNGSFRDLDIRWDAHLLTREHYNSLHPDAPVTGRFLEVGPVSGDRVKLTVCLDVACIDQPTILKTIIMIRKYRRLGAGRHEFGRQSRR